ncbi:major facilitator superfamily domain-containing protein [Aspergillus pseudoustus]|uniref:Major facilitator superfamily domain-containing protein n=1 Tax=Aspergillus pseudoustus TaxID=1810923 RepID=A0ABR4JG03_9EURO
MDREPDGMSETEVPGTVFFVNKDKTVDGPHDGSGSEIVLVPRPLDTARDPLNWSALKKAWSMFLATLFATVMAYGENNMGAAWTQISEETDVSLGDMNGGSALNYLLLGFVNIIWVSTAMKLGRKIVYISAMLIVMATSLWNAYIYGTVQWYFNNLIGGIGQGAYQAIIQLTVFDIFFAHQRGTMLAIYAWGQQLGTILGLITGGYTAEGPGWRWGCKIVAILCGVVALLFIFTFDDSLFPRHALGTVTRQRDTVRQSAHDTHRNAIGEDTKKEASADANLGRTATLDQGVAGLLPRNYWHVLAPIHRFKEDKTSWWQYFRRPFLLFTFPNILIAGFIYAFANTAGIVSFNTISEIMTEAPYSWGTGATGLLFLAALIGSFIGMGTGALGDILVLRLARRNAGYKEPEMRLWILAFAFVYAAVGYFMYGWAANGGKSWVLIAVGLGAMIAQQVTAASVATAYAMECFEGVSSELVVVLAIFSSCINFAMSFSVQPFIDATDYGRTFTFFGGLVVGSTALAIPGLVWGKSWRRWCAARYWRFVNEGVVV